MTAPRRLLDDVEADSSTRAGVDALAGLDPEYDVAAGAARFQATIDAGGSGLQSDGSPALSIVKGSLVAAIVVGVGVVLWAAWPREPAQPIATLSPSIAIEELPELPRAPRPARIVATARTGEAEASVAPAEIDAPPPVRRPKAAGPRASQPAASDPPDDDRFAREMRLLNAARRHVRSRQAAAALRTIEQSRTLRSGSTFGEEWDALEILALAGAGRLEEARRKAVPFLAAHPRGRFNPSIEKATAHGEGSPP